MSEGPDRGERTESFLDRFVHPRLAAVAVGGALAWLLSFLVAASGVAVRASGRPVLAAELFFASGLVGLAGTVTLAGCALWLAGLWARRFAAGLRG